MPTFLYRCPNTGQTVLGVTAEDTSEDAYEAITCLACRQSHFVNSTTGKVLGGDDDGKAASVRGFGRQLENITKATGSTPPFNTWNSSNAS